MIRSVCIRGFKRFREVEFRLPGHVVLAGPNDTGKTTMLQALMPLRSASKACSPIGATSFLRQW
jgi:predicted ATPase